MFVYICTNTSFKFTSEAIQKQHYDFSFTNKNSTQSKVVISVEILKGEYFINILCAMLNCEKCVFNGQIEWKRVLCVIF